MREMEYILGNCVHARVYVYMYARVTDMYFWTGKILLFSLLLIVFPLRKVWIVGIIQKIEKK